MDTNATNTITLIPIYQKLQSDIMSKNEYISGILNFFLLGPGYIYNGQRQVLGLFLTFGAILATYVEFQLQGLFDSSNENKSLYNIMFVGFFLLAIGTAYDAYQEAKEINEKNK